MQHESFLNFFFLTEDQFNLYPTGIKKNKEVINITMLKCNINIKSVTKGYINYKSNSML